MSLHDEIMALECDESESDQFIIGHIEARHTAAALAIKADAEIARTNGENAVLRDLLRDAMDVMRAFSRHGGDWIASKILEDRIAVVLNENDAVMPSDGAIYAEASRRAAPESHAEMDKLVADVLSTARTASCWLMVDVKRTALEIADDLDATDAKEEASMLRSQHAEIERLREALAEKREACAKVCEKAKESISVPTVIGEEAWAIGTNCCDNLAAMIRGMDD